MTVNRLSVFGTPHIGIFMYVNNRVAIIPPGLTSSEKDIIRDTLRVELVETKIAGSIAVGALVAGNDNGLILPRTINDEELEYLVENTRGYGINIVVLRSKYTAIGNILLANNKAAIVGEILEKNEVKKIEDALGVEVVQRNIMGLPIPGSLAVITDTGGAIHPDISDKEIVEIEKIMGVEIERATVNAGVPFIKSGLVANNNGVLVGELTTGPEIMRIQRGLGVK